MIVPVDLEEVFASYPVQLLAIHLLHLKLNAISLLVFGCIPTNHHIRFSYLFLGSLWSDRSM